MNKNFDQLSQCLKSLNHKFTIIRLTETQLKDNPHDYLQLPDKPGIYMNRVGRNSGGVCLYIRNDIKYKLRPDLCIIETENDKSRNAIVGIIYRAHTSIDCFNADIDYILQILTKESKNHYLLDDFNIDLSEDETHGPTSDFLDLIYSYHLVPTISKLTRINETSATIIGKIMTNSNEHSKTGIIITDKTDHFPTVFYLKKKKKRICSNKIHYCK